MIDEDNQLGNDQPTAEPPEENQIGNDDPSVEGTSLQDESVTSSEFASVDQVDVEQDATADQPVMPNADGAGSADSAQLQEEIGGLQQEIASLKAQVEDRTGQYMRIAADFDNFRKRTQKEREELEQKAKCSAISELLPVVDNFERARSHIKPQTDQEMSIHKSYQSVYKQLVDCLKRVGVAPMRSEGKEFDPGLHEAVMREATDEYPEGTVMEELVRGYLLGERVLRHAMVKVAAAPEPVVASEENAQGDTDN